MVSIKLAIRDDPNIRLRCSRNVKSLLVLPMKNTRLTTTPPSTLPPVCVLVNAGTHGDVLNLHTGFLSVPHHTYTPQTPHALPHITQHHTKTETESDRERRQRQRREDQREEGKTREDERKDEREKEGEDEKKTREEKRREEREDSFFSVVVHVMFIPSVTEFSAC